MSATELLSLELIIASKKAEVTKYQELKRKEIDPLVKKRDQLAKKLYDYMKQNKLVHYNGVKIEQVAPKEKVVRVKVDRSMQIFKLRQMGIRNPEEALSELGI